MRVSRDHGAPERSELMFWQSINCLTQIPHSYQVLDELNILTQSSPFVIPKRKFNQSM
ncbi:hypothetical protein RHECNPAF_122100176 [Rhizobium etli CNPAF512]|nr:hypothetical protein RHECNPAF_122100176 [Rhizobium etli CNPAF512]